MGRREGISECFIPLMRRRANEPDRPVSDDSKAFESQIDSEMIPYRKRIWQYEVGS